ncbi:hypothetical protein HDIA_1196 [Hartmannibacter diazotrophicus]|uniref:YHS domain protein n=1 Tax=Hartmannibacter diazotrophicus TaxID=1482074 RepID=A0A2C9D330_9HYPH|nr:YHS domain-containing (seleno)protein [Hartmannibacter diazotrophicus]SON54737.1 hypothetical protein HDIA_1196 [Hartmannibacter diazotrophicus]
MTIGFSGHGLGAGLGLFVLAAVMHVVPALAGEINVQDGAAISGYDPVAYFEDGMPVEGKPSITATHKGAEFRFASEAHRAAFIANPEKFAPQYGGYCAFAVAQGAKAKIEPEAYSIVDGKLYLNFDKSVQAKWSEDIPGYVMKGDAYWPSVKDQ